MVERSKRIELRVTEDELMKIRDRMEEAGISSLTAYLVRMAIHGYVIVMDLSDLKEILRLLQISGNNLNQYARKANETGSIYHEDIEELKNNQKEILQEMRKVLYGSSENAGCKEFKESGWGQADHSCDSSSDT